MKFLFFSILSINLAFASFLPKDLEVHIKSAKQNDQTLKSIYSPIVNELLNLYKEEVQLQHNANLFIEFDFSRDAVNAFAKRTGDQLENWHITFLGGLMRHPKLNKNIFAAILCHELGHHLAGFPTKANDSWVSVEGQSDYFAANFCLKKLIQSSTVLTFPSKKHPFIIDKCQKLYSDEEQKNICIQTAHIAKDIGYFLHVMKQSRRGRRGKKADITKRDSNSVSSTTVQHPNSQCRLDTFFEGALCDEYFISGHNLHYKNCSNSKKIYLGSRPSCWFKE